MVKGKGEPCLSAVIQYRAERRPDRPADKEDTYGGYDMHFSLYTTLCPLQNVIPMLQIGFSFFQRRIWAPTDTYISGSPVSKLPTKP